MPNVETEELIPITIDSYYLFVIIKFMTNMINLIEVILLDNIFTATIVLNFINL